MERLTSLNNGIDGATRFWGLACIVMASLVLLFAPPPFTRSALATGSCTDPENPCTGPCCNGTCCNPGQVCCNGTCCSSQCFTTSGGSQICCTSSQIFCNDACCSASVCCNGTNCGYECDDNGDGTPEACKSCTIGGTKYCKQCDNNGDGVNESCKVCDTNSDGTADACYICDTNDDGTKDSCAYQCDSDGNGSLDECFLCDNNGNGKNDACYACDTNEDGANDTCDKKCDSNGDGTKDSCFLCDNNGNGKNEACYSCDTDNDGKYDACYSFDTDGDGTKDSCCPTFRVNITFTDEFMGRSRTKAGVGETGNLVATQANGQVMGAVTYSTSDATCVAINAGSGAWDAKDKACDAQLCATANGCKQCKTLTVVLPGGVIIEQEPGTGVKHTINTGSVGFKGRPYITPPDVSFNAIQVREEAVAGVGTGYFLGDVTPHNQGSWVSVDAPVPGKGSKLAGFDSISSNENNAPFSAGTFTWAIPWSWKLGGGAAAQFTVVNHVETINANGDMTISKGGHSESKLYGDATSSW
jgi:hypothetical protein